MERLVILLLAAVSTSTANFLDQYFRSNHEDFRYDYYDDIIVPSGGNIGGGGGGGSAVDTENIAGVNRGGHGMSEEQSTGLNLCYLAGSGKPMVCKCDRQVISISCHIGGNVSADDDIWDVFSQGPNIQRLRINSLPEGSLQYVPSKAMGYLVNLERLDFKYAHIGKIHAFAFSRLPLLAEIDLSSNKVDILATDAFSHLPSLSTLTLSENYLAEIKTRTFVALIQLQKLYLDRNNISIIEDGAFSDMKSLRELDLWGNRLQTLRRDMFHGLQHLHILDLSSNFIRRLTNNVFGHLTQLTHLHLHHNEIDTVDEGAFDNLHRLMVLRMQANRLVVLMGTPFSHLHRLMLLDLRENKLRTLSAPVINTLSNLRNTSGYFHFEDNPFRCECANYWMMTLMSETIMTPTHSVLEKVRCQMKNEALGHWLPEDPENPEIPLTDVPWSQLGCEPKTTTTTLPPITSRKKMMTESVAAQPKVQLTPRLAHQSEQQTVHVGTTIDITPASTSTTTAVVGKAYEATVPLEVKPKPESEPANKPVELAKNGGGNDASNNGSQRTNLICAPTTASIVLACFLWSVILH